MNNKVLLVLKLWLNLLFAHFKGKYNEILNSISSSYSQTALRLEIKCLTESE